MLRSAVARVDGLTHHQMVRHVSAGDARHKGSTADI